MSLRQKIEDDLKAAMKARQEARLSAIRLLKSAVKYREIELGKTLDDVEVIGVVNSLVKQRRDAAEQYRAGSRADAALKEEAEIAVLHEFLPKQLSRAEIEELVVKAIAETGAAGPKDMGMVMKRLKEIVAGRADGKTLSDLVRERLQRQ
jgi:uncharacterized protein YqeY